MVIDGERVARLLLVTETPDGSCLVVDPEWICRHGREFFGGFNDRSHHHVWFQVDGLPLPGEIGEHPLIRDQYFIDFCLGPKDLLCLWRVYFFSK